MRFATSDSGSIRNWHLTKCGLCGTVIDAMEDSFIRLVREKQDMLDLTQEQFAKRIGVHRSTLTYFYQGRRSPKVAAAAARAFPELRDAAILFLYDIWPAN